jgi:phenylalanyl-tRNA synthetase alpha chain
MTSEEKIIESLSANERKILPHIEERSIIEICKKSNLDKVSTLRALEYLQSKNLLKINEQKKKIIQLGVNGALYKKKGLPERRLLEIINEKRIISMQEAPKLASLNEDEFKASLGALKKKAMIEIKNGKIILNASKEEVTKKTLEESFIESLPREIESLQPEEQYALKSLQSRKEIIEIEEGKIIEIQPTELGIKISRSKIKEENFIEQITSDMIKSESWRGKKFRRYDLNSKTPSIYGGKRHFVNQATDYARKIWTDMGFEEMDGTFVQQSFWNFDALFTAQDHPVREMQDTFFLKEKVELPEKTIVKSIKDAHEKGIGGSKGWQYSWNEEEAKTLVLRTHTTSLSAHTLYNLAKNKEEKLPKKFFALGKCFRNETVDWSHGFEFNQTEGIVIDKNANFRHLLGYLKQFFKKMGFEKIRMRPAYFPYTEPSVEIDAWHPEKKVWLELGGAGIFRPEVVIPILGENIPVLAWGPGFDRIIMDYYKIKDLREMYKNDIKQLRQTKFWMRT